MAGKVQANFRESVILLRFKLPGYDERRLRLVSIISRGRTLVLRRIPYRVRSDGSLLVNQPGIGRDFRDLCWW